MLAQSVIEFVLGVRLAADAALFEIRSAVVVHVGSCRVQRFAIVAFVCYGVLRIFGLLKRVAVGVEHAGISGHLRAFY